jgi:hypothetical protein
MGHVPKRNQAAYARELRERRTALALAGFCAQRGIDLEVAKAVIKGIEAGELPCRPGYRRATRPATATPSSAA